MVDQEKKNLLDLIIENLEGEEGREELPRDFSLPQYTKVQDDIITWADGARDGVFSYEFGLPEVSEEDIESIEEAINLASAENFINAREIFADLGERIGALAIIDDLQGCIIRNLQKLNLDNIYRFALGMLIHSVKAEEVKIGLGILELFFESHQDELKSVIKVLGLSDELTLFAVFNMRQWDDGNDEIFDLIQRVHGWGRIFALEELQPLTDEIKHWILLEGVKNDVEAFYSALTCWEKADVEEKLEGDLTQEDFSGIGDIIYGLLDSAPEPMISEIEDGDNYINLFLDHAKIHCKDINDYLNVFEVLYHYKEFTDRQSLEIVEKCEKILTTDQCKQAIKEAIKSAKAIDLARYLGIEYKEDVFESIKNNFPEKSGFIYLLWKDQEYRKKIIDLYREKLPLEKLKGQPTLDIWSKDFGQECSALEFFFNQIAYYQEDLEDFVEVGLQSQVQRTRSCALGVLERWVEKDQRPLKDYLPKFHKLLASLVDEEPSDHIKESMQGLLDGNITFD